MAATGSADRSFVGTGRRVCLRRFLPDGRRSAGDGPSAVRPRCTGRDPARRSSSSDGWQCPGPWAGTGPYDYAVEDVFAGESDLPAVLPHLPPGGPGHLRDGADAGDRGRSRIVWALGVAKSMLDDVQTWRPPVPMSDMASLASRPTFRRTWRCTSEWRAALILPSALPRWSSSPARNRTPTTLGGHAWPRPTPPMARRCAEWAHLAAGNHFDPEPGAGVPRHLHRDGTHSSVRVGRHRRRPDLALGIIETKLGQKLRFHLMRPAAVDTESNCDQGWVMAMTASRGRRRHRALDHPADLLPAGAHRDRRR